PSPGSGARGVRIPRGVPRPRDRRGRGTLRGDRGLRAAARLTARRLRGRLDRRGWPRARPGVVRLEERGARHAHLRLAARTLGTHAAARHALEVGERGLAVRTGREPGGCHQPPLDFFFLVVGGRVRFADALAVLAADGRYSAGLAGAVRAGAVRDG